MLTASNPRPAPGPFHLVVLLALAWLTATAPQAQTPSAPTNTVPPPPPVPGRAPQPIAPDAPARQWQQRYAIKTNQVGGARTNQGAPAALPSKEEQLRLTRARAEIRAAELRAKRTESVLTGPEKRELAQLESLLRAPKAGPPTATQPSTPSPSPTAPKPAPSRP